MNHNDPSNSGVVDPSILDVTLEGNADGGGIPTFLRRQPEAPTGEAALAQLNDEEQGYVNEDPEADQPADAPTFTTKVNEEGQVELAVEGNNHPTGDLTHNNQSNQPASPEEMRKDAFRDFNKFGKASGEGASALGRLGLRVLRAAADGVLSTAKPQGGGKDDATLVYEAYTAMDSKHAEHTAGGAKANASKVRQIIGMGCMTTISDAVAIGDKVVRIREEMEGADLKPKALFAALVDVSREQQASDTELTDDAIRGCLTKTKADKTLEKEWEAIYKKAEALITGEGSHGLKDNSDSALKIVELMSEHIKQFKAGGARNELVEELMERGYTRAMAENIVDKKLD